MRIFATGAMNWVIGKLPDDKPIEAKMVTRAVERAQSKIEDLNYELRKNVLKYDEVMNDQRKVIYRRRQQILDGATCSTRRWRLRRGGRPRTVRANCLDAYPDDWDLAGLHLQDGRHLPHRASGPSSSTGARTEP